MTTASVLGGVVCARARMRNLTVGDPHLHYRSEPWPGAKILGDYALATYIGKVSGGPESVTTWDVG